jgi:NDP-sugar pyrophosphorylase family protein
VGDGCRIAEDACLEGAILWEGVSVGPGAVVRDCVIGARAQVGAHARVGPGVALESGAVVPDHATFDR